MARVRNRHSQHKSFNVQFPFTLESLEIESRLAKTARFEVRATAGKVRNIAAVRHSHRIFCSHSCTFVVGGKDLGM